MTEHTASLRRRWEGLPWSARLIQIVSMLQKGGRLEQPDLPRWGAHVDLRALPLPKAAELSRVNFSDSSLDQKYEAKLGERIQFKETVVDHIDLTSSELASSDWHQCTFRDVIFNKADLRAARFSECIFDNVKFEGANLTGASLGGYFGTGPNAYRQSSFVRADMRETSHRHSLFEDVDFSYAKLDKVDFRGSQFVRCKFAGRLMEVRFHGSYAGASNDDIALLARRGIDPNSIRNPMKDVDFSHAQLRGVQFLDGLDISSCILPRDDLHIVVHDRGELYHRAKSVVERDWHGPEREDALDLLDLFLGPGVRHRGRLEEGLRKAYTGKELERYLAANERSYSALRSQTMMIIHHDEFTEVRKRWTERLFKIVAGLASNMGSSHN